MSTRMGYRYICTDTGLSLIMSTKRRFPIVTKLDHMHTFDTVEVVALTLF